MARCSRRRLALVVLLVLSSWSVRAQSPERRFDASAHVAVASTSQFEGSEVGVGGRFGWRLFPLFGVEAETTYYPSDFPDDFAISEARWEGFFGGTFGPQLGRVRPFARVRPGFLRYRPAPEPIACIAIFPPPLECTIAAGRTVLAIDLGGGIDVDLFDDSFVRIDVGDRAVRYEGQSFDFTRRPPSIVDNLWSHGVRVAVGAGFRF